MRFGKCANREPRASGKHAGVRSVNRARRIRLGGMPPSDAGAFAVVALTIFDEAYRKMSHLEQLGCVDLS